MDSNTDIDGDTGDQGSIDPQSGDWSFTLTETATDACDVEPASESTQAVDVTEDGVAFTDFMNHIAVYDGDFFDQFVTTRRGTTFDGDDQRDKDYNLITGVDCVFHDRVSVAGTFPSSARMEIQIGYAIDLEGSDCDGFGRTYTGDGAHSTYPPCESSFAFVGTNGAEADTDTGTDLDGAPTVVIVHPAAGEYGNEGEPFLFVASVSDGQDAPGDLRVTFMSDVDGIFAADVVPDTAGTVSIDAVLSTGEHVLVVTVDDSDGQRSLVSESFVVVAG